MVKSFSRRVRAVGFLGFFDPQAVRTVMGFLGV